MISEEDEDDEEIKNNESWLPKFLIVLLVLCSIFSLIMLIFTMIYTIDKESVSSNASLFLSLPKGACTTNVTLNNYRPLSFSLQCADEADVYCGNKNFYNKKKW